MKPQKRAVQASENDDEAFDSAPSAVCKASHEEIAAFAHHLYQEEGCPEGRADDHWFVAEGLLNSKTSD